MIFSFHGTERIFVHIPKTGGNTLQAFLVSAGMTRDRIVTKGHQDGVERFGVSGALTKQKHQSLAEYVALDARCAGMQVVACVRRPFERLVSLYFSPHRWLPEAGASRSGGGPEKVVFSEDEFVQLARQSKAAWQMLSTSGDEYAPPSRLTIFRFESLDLDMAAYFGVAADTPMVERRNVSPFKDEARKVLESAELRAFVETTHHARDNIYFT